MVFIHVTNDPIKARYMENQNILGISNFGGKPPEVKV